MREIKTIIPILAILAGTLVFPGCKPSPVEISVPHSESAGPGTGLDRPTPAPTPTPAPQTPDSVLPGSNGIVQLPPKPTISPKGYQLILDFEVGGGKPYYDRFLSRPTVPPAQSGVTIGVGYDLRWYPKTTILRDWHMLPGDHASRLSGASGLNNSQSKNFLPRVRDIVIVWNDAEKVFQVVSLSQWVNNTRKAFPGFDALHPDAQAVLVSLCFNRGTSMAGESRREMRNLRPLVEKRDYRGMAGEIRSMKRLWPNIPGLIRRREAEAKLMESVVGG
jgi:hypothetical protein